MKEQCALHFGTNYVTSLSLASFFSKRSEMIFIYSLDRSVLPAAQEGCSRYFLNTRYQQITWVDKVTQPQVVFSTARAAQPATQKLPLTALIFHIDHDK